MKDAFKSIWKFELKADDLQTVSMPPNSKVLTAQVQRGRICLWVMVDPNNGERIEYPVWIHGTGHPLQEAVSQGRYVASVQLDEGAFVFHVFVGLGA